MTGKITKLLGRKTCARRGFSLIEVTIALGIVVFAGITVIGVIPVGLLILRDAMNDTAESQIVQSITNDIVLTNYSDLVNYSKRFYDVEGMPIGTQGGTAPSNTFYTATIITPIMDLASTIPNLSSGVGGTVIINIVRANQPLKPDSFSVIVANNQGLLQKS